MKVKVLTQFKDRHSGKVHKKGETLTVSKERLDEILGVGPFVAEIKDSKKTKKAAE